MAADKASKEREPSWPPELADPPVADDMPGPMEGGAGVIKLELRPPPGPSSLRPCAAATAVLGLK